MSEARIEKDDKADALRIRVEFQNYSDAAVVAELFYSPVKNGVPVLPNPVPDRLAFAPRDKKVLYIGPLIGDETRRPFQFVVNVIYRDNGRSAVYVHEGEFDPSSPFISNKSSEWVFDDAKMKKRNGAFIMPMPTP